jgi:hypothetical protein
MSLKMASARNSEFEMLTGKHRHRRAHVRRKVSYCQRLRMCKPRAERTLGALNRLAGESPAGGRGVAHCERGVGRLAMAIGRDETFLSQSRADAAVVGGN